MTTINVTLNATPAGIASRSIKCLKYEDKLNKLAVLRTNYLEIWNVKDSPYKEKAMPLMCNDTIVAWLQGNLFTAGKSNFIKHIDLTSLTIKNKITLEYGQCDCLETNHGDTQMAVATTSGVLCLLELSGIKLTEKIFARLSIEDGAVTCLAWHPEDSQLAVGAMRAIYIYKVADRTHLNTLALDQLVWSLTFLRHTLVTGESTGQVSFWDADTLDKIQSLRIHASNVLALCATKDEKHVWASGEDPIVVQFSRSTKTRSWHRTIERKSLHTNDVRALTMAKKFLVSGGIDTQLVFSSYPPLTIIRCQPYAQVEMAKLAYHTKELLVSDDHLLHLYKLPPVSAKGKRAMLLGTIESPALRCFAFSPDSKFLAYSFIVSTSLMIKDEKGYQLQDLSLAASHYLEFSADSLKLYLAAITGKIFLLDLSSGCPETYANCSSDKTVYYRLAADTQGKKIAAADDTGVVNILDAVSLEMTDRLPMNPYPVSCMAFHPELPHVLVIVYVNNWMIQYDTAAESVLANSGLQLGSVYPVVGLTFDPEQPRQIVLHTQKSLFFVTTSSSEEEEPPLKKRKSGKRQTEEVKTQLEAATPTVETLDCSGYLLSAVSHTPNHLTLLDLSAKNLQACQCLPMKKKRFNAPS